MGGKNLGGAPPPEPVPGGTREMMGFETLTLVPFDRRLIDPRQLLPYERAWVNAYHARVRRGIEPILLSDDRAWLRHATAPLGGWRHSTRLSFPGLPRLPP